MKKCDSKKSAIQIKEDGAVIPLSGMEICVQVVSSSNGTVLKTFVYNWSGQETGTLLPVDTDSNFFIVYLTGTEVDAAADGIYDLHIWYLQTDTDFPGGTRRRYGKIDGKFTIIDD